LYGLIWLGQKALDWFVRVSAYEASWSWWIGAYIVVGVVLGAVVCVATFLGAWIWSVTQKGFWGFAVGWLPSGLLAGLLGLLTVPFWGLAILAALMLSN
jgi:hypothetical protein